MQNFFGTFWRVIGGCGSAIISAIHPDFNIGILGVAFAFGLSVLTMAYAVGHISGGHFNPAVSIGFAVAGKFKVTEFPGYIIAQVIGAIAAAGVTYLIASGSPGFNVDAGFAANGYAEHSLGKYSITSGLKTEVVMTLFFLIIILGSTD